MVGTPGGMGHATGWRTALVDRGGGSAQSHPSAQHVVSELGFKLAGVDERPLVVVAALGHPDGKAVERRRSSESYAWPLPDYKESE
jgi:hypothetical protein